MGITSMKIIHKIKNSTTEISIETSPIIGGSYRLIITRDSPAFNHAYRESIDLSVEDTKVLRDELNQFITKYEKV